MKKRKTGLTPIKLDKFVDLYLKNNPETSRKEITSALKSALYDFKRSVRCECGNPIWVIGSAVAGNACFTCITGETQPDGDYEIEEAMK